MVAAPSRSVEDMDLKFFGVKLGAMDAQKKPQTNFERQFVNVKNLVENLNKGKEKELLDWTGWSLGVQPPLRPKALRNSKDFGDFPRSALTKEPRFTGVEDEMPFPIDPEVCVRCGCTVGTCRCDRKPKPGPEHCCKCTKTHLPTADCPPPPRPRSPFFQAFFSAEARARWAAIITRRGRPLSLITGYIQSEEAGYGPGGQYGRSEWARKTDDEKAKIEKDNEGYWDYGTWPKKPWPE